MTQTAHAKHSKRIFSIIAILLCAAAGVISPGLAHPVFDGGGSYLPLLLNAWPTPVPGRLLISEVIYDPDGAEPGGEWIEIYNAGGSPVDLSAYKIGDEETLGELEGMYSFPAGAVIAPLQALVVAVDAGIYFRLYGLIPDFELRGPDPDVPDMVRYTAWAGGGIELVNTGDEVLILDGGDQVIDALSWGSCAFAFDPSAPKVSGGHSLERFPPEVDTDTALDWRDQPLPSPGRVERTAPVQTPSSTGGTPPVNLTPEPTWIGDLTLTPGFSPTPTCTTTPVPPFALVINEIYADPHPSSGDANGDGSIGVTADEFIEIVNVTGSTLDLSGWEIRDLVRARHRFPPGSLLPAGSAVVVFGGGQPQGSFGGSLVQTASSGTLAINNEGDTLALYDLNSFLVTSYSYGPEGGEDEALTREPDLTGPEPLVKHSTASGSGGTIYSPGTRLDGSNF
jgi:hypothetical protein